MVNNCALNIKKHYTCFDKHELISIIKAFNDYIIKGHLELCKNPDKCINVNKTSLITYQNDDNIKILWKKIYKALNPLCEYEYCWVNLDFIKIINDNKLKQKLMYFTFKPKLFKNRSQLLNTNDIDNVMKQYENAYPNFYYIGTHACDFYKYIKIDFQKIVSTQKVGIIFNLDNIKLPGSHWTSCFINNLTSNIYYFDSEGYSPNKCIFTFLKMLLSYNNKYTLYINTKRHQKGNTECGVYSIYFLLKQLVHNNHVYKPVTIIKDSKMKNFRKHIFITN
jgi:hypothetical protein